MERKMKKIKMIFVFAAFLFVINFACFAQQTQPSQNAQSQVSNSQENSKETAIDPKTGFLSIVNKPFVVFDWGASYGMVTRIQTQETRSNFVYQDHLLGLYGDIQTYNMKPFDSIFRLTAYFPFYKTFNGMKQKSKQTLLYAVDFYWGPRLELDMWKYIRFNLSAGPHFMYELTDAYHLIYLGGELLVRTELPLSEGWTLLLDALATMDYANFGSNSQMQIFNVSYQYQFNFGARYSKKATNEYSYIKSRPKTPEQLAKIAEKEASKQAKQAAKQAALEAKQAQQQSQQ